jgi:hypothetical protein
LVQQGLELDVVAHAIEQRVANQKNPAARGQRKGQPRCGIDSQEEKRALRNLQPKREPETNPSLSFLAAATFPDRQRKTILLNTLKVTYM